MSRTISTEHSFIHLVVGLTTGPKVQNVTIYPICTSAVKLIQLYVKVLTKTVTFYSTHFAYITDIYIYTA
jgi:hypothetical protein